MVAVKICGLTDEAGFDAAVEHGADWVGLNFFARSPRVVSPARAASLSRRHPGGPGRIGLFVSPADDDIARVLGEVPLDGLQLYGTAERALALQARFGLPVWLAHPVSSRADLPTVPPQGGTSVQRLLIESRPPKNADRPGGNGVALDWTLFHAWQAPMPWILAGGLDPENVRRAIVQSGASAVDVSSGVESSPGVKSPERIAAFIDAAKAA